MRPERTESKRAIEDALGSAFDDVAPMRDFPSYRRQPRRRIPGLYWAASRMPRLP